MYEKKLLSLLLMKPHLKNEEEFQEVLKLDEGLFKNRELFIDMRDQLFEGKEIDIEVINTKHDKEILFSVMNMDCLPSQIEFYIEQFKEESKKGKLIETIDKAFSNKQEKTYDFIQDEIEKALKSNSDTLNGTVKDTSTMLNDFFSFLDNPENTRIMSGYRNIDEVLNMEKSDLVIVAARPSIGKSCFAGNLALAMTKKDKRGMIVSLEMSGQQWTQRWLAALSGVHLSKIRSKNLNETDYGKLGICYDKLKNRDLLMLDNKFSLNNIIAEIRAAHRTKAFDFIMIDYIQLIEVSGKENRQQQISEISRRLKLLAKELNTVIIGLSQLSRAVEQRADRVPVLSDLRESGAIEQDADTVMFLYRDEYYNESTERKNQMDIIIGKQRNGPLGTVTLDFYGGIQRLLDRTR